jgi:hypothetical protein
MIPFVFVFAFLMDENLSETAGTAVMVIFISLGILLSIGSTLLYVVSSSAVSLGVVRLERGEGSMTFMDLLKDSFVYFWRELGVMLLIQLSIGLIFTLFFGCVFLSIAATMGMASICWQPILILITPLMFLFLGFMEAAQTSVIAEDLGPVDAIKRAFAVVREHVWKYVIISLIIYFANMVLSSTVMFPAMIPLFLFPFLMETNGEMNSLFPMVMALFVCIFFPLMTIFSVLTQTLLKTSLGLTYLRLAQPAENQVIHLEENPK